MSLSQNSHVSLKAYCAADDIINICSNDKNRVDSIKLSISKITRIYCRAFSSHWCKLGGTFIEPFLCHFSQIK
jgi:hypothetical protein